MMCRLQSAVATFGVLLAIGLPAAYGGLWTDDYDDALKRAQTETRFILLDFTGSDWCGWCKRLDAEVFSKSEFKEFAKNNLVCVTLDFPRGFSLPGKTVKQNVTLAREFQITGYPTIILLDPDGKAIARTGYLAGGAEAYVSHLESLIAPHRERFGAPKSPPGAGSTAAADPDYRRWTSAKGSSVDARLEQRVGSVLHLRTREGKLVLIDVSALSAADQAYLNPLAAVP